MKEKLVRMMERKGEKEGKWERKSGRKITGGGEVNMEEEDKEQEGTGAISWHRREETKIIKRI